MSRIILHLTFAEKIEVVAFSIGDSPDRGTSSSSGRSRSRSSRHLSTRNKKAKINRFSSKFFHVYLFLLLCPILPPWMRLDLTDPTFQRWEKNSAQSHEPRAALQVVYFFILVRDRDMCVQAIVSSK